MFGIGNFNPVSLLAGAAFGPLGGIVAQLAQQVISQFGQQFIQQLGQNLGLPQNLIDDAKNAYGQQSGVPFAGGGNGGGGSARGLDDAINAYGEARGSTPQQIGEAQNAAKSILDDVARDCSESDEVKDAKASGGASSWLLALAKAMGAKADKLADKLSEQGQNLDGGSPSDSAEFSATTQQFNMLMNALNTAVKSIGDALANTARKQ